MHHRLLNMIGLSALALAAAAPAQRPAAPVATAACQRLYFGTWDAGPGFGIGTAALDTATGRLSAPRVVAGVFRPTWLLADPARPLLYAVSDPRDPPGDGPQVLTYAIDRTSGDLQPLGATAPGGAGPTHLDLDRRSGTVFVGHYGSGQVTALPLTASGVALAPVATAQNSGKGPTPRQAGPHAHGVTLDPSGRWLLSADLGADRVFVYRFDPRTRQLTPAPTPFTQLPPGTGPRHLTFSPDGRFAYLVTELAAEVRAFGWDAREGRLREVQTLPLDPPGFTGTRSGAEIAVSRDGRFLYASNRGDDTIEVYAVDRKTGVLTEIQRAPSGGKLPWAFAFAPDGRWLVVGTQGTNAIAVLPVDPRTGRLGASVGTAPFGKPVAVAFAGGATRCL